MYKLITHLNAYELYSDISNLCKRITSEIESKYEAMEKREAFTKYKTAPVGSHQREQNRKEYIEKANINKNWQTKKEIPFN